MSKKILIFFAVFCFIFSVGYPVLFAQPVDTDGDGIPDVSDNCPIDYNPGQEDNDSDGLGDICDPDDDNDGVPDTSDNCPMDSNSSQADNDSDGLGDVCDPDDDNDGVNDGSDNCPLISNADQANNDGDSQGDVCDPDDDNDSVLDAVPDNCQFVYNPRQEDWDCDGMGDACDPDDDDDGILDVNEVCSQFSSTAPFNQAVDFEGCTSAERKRQARYELSEVLDLCLSQDRRNWARKLVADALRTFERRIPIPAPVACTSIWNDPNYYDESTFYTNRNGSKVFNQTSSAERYLYKVLDMNDSKLSSYLGGCGSPQELRDAINSALLQMHYADRFLAVHQLDLSNGAVDPALWSEAEGYVNQADGLYANGERLLPLRLFERAWKTIFIAP